MNIHETIETLKDNLQSGGDHLEQTTALQAGKAFARKQAALTTQLTEQARELQILRRDVDILQRQRPSKGGFPWVLILLAGGVYALYRSNPGVRDQINGVLKRTSPDLEGDLTHAGDAGKAAVTEVAHGDAPSVALERLSGEAQRTGEKATEQTKDKVAELKDETRGGIGNLKRDTEQFKSTKG